MITSISDGLMADEPTWTEPRSDSVHASAIHGTTAPKERQSLEEGFNWGRIRRLSKKA
jgi:hypothetical protein